MTRHIVSFSGGKDSTAMLLMMLERGMPVDEVRFFDTSWEFPAMHEHIAQVEEYTGLSITKLSPKISLTDLMIHHPGIQKKGSRKGEAFCGYGWASPLRRWCTGIKNKKLYAGTLKDANWHIGFAADEADRAVRLARKNQFARFPLVDWNITEDAALQYCMDRGFHWGGLYEHFRRVSCFCCPLQRLGDLKKLRRHFPELWQEMLDWDAQMVPPRYYREDMFLSELEIRSTREQLIEDTQYAILDPEVA